MQGYLAHPADVSRGHTVEIDGRRLTMQALGRDIIHGEAAVASAPRPSYKKQFPTEAGPFDDDDRPRRRDHTGVKRLPQEPHLAPRSPVVRRGVPPAQRQSPLEVPRRVRKPVDAIAKWQQVGYDTLNPNGIQYEDDFLHKPAGENVFEADRSAKARFREACFGGGSGASMGLIRHIFRRFDSDGDGLLTREELRLGLASRNRDVTHFDAFWAEVDRDANDKIDMLELARALADDQEADVLLAPDESLPAAGSPAPKVGRGRRDGGAIAEWQRAPYDILSPNPRPRSRAASPERTKATSLDRLKAQLAVACHGAGAGASMGLLRSIFRHFDEDGDGRISAAEVTRGLKMHGVDVVEADLGDLMVDMDLNRDGYVSLAEFAHAVCGGFAEPEHPDVERARRPPVSIEQLRADFESVPQSTIRNVFGTLVRSGCPKSVPCGRLAEALRRHALLDVTEADLAQLSASGALTMEALYAAVYTG